MFVIKLITYVLIFINIILFLVKYGSKFLYLLQLEKYSITYAIKYISGTIKNRWILHIYSMVFFAIFILSNYSMMVILIYEIMTLYFLINDDITIRSKIVVTSRLKRIVILSVIMYLIISIITLQFYGLCAAMIFTHMVYYIYYLIVSLAMVILSPIENLIGIRYIVRAKKKLGTLTHTKVIAITGSYGKTSVKNILYNILATTYLVVMTPKSFNTIFGITKTVLGDLEYYHDYIILEMGADRAHDIEKLCKLVKVDYGIITAIGRQHIASFKSMENVAREKLSLQRFVLDNGGVTLLNNYNSGVCRYTHMFSKSVIKNRLLCKPNYTMCDIRYILSNYVIVGGDVYMYTQVSLSTKGTTFTVTKNGREYHTFTTKLVGLHSVQNVLVAIAMADTLGVTKSCVARGLERVQNIESRMEVKECSNGGVIINNGYNSNIDSVTKTIKTMSLYKDRVKVVITPGLIECGDKQYEYNYNLGLLLSKYVDIVYVVGSINKQAITDGVESNNERKVKVYHLSHKSMWQDIVRDIKPNEVILFENDLPENYEV